MRLAIVASHPIQYHSPWFRHLAGHLDVEVFYAHRQDASGQAAAGFGVPFDWDTPLLDGYSYRFMKNVAAKPSLDSFGGCDTPEIYQVIRQGQYGACLVFGWNHKFCLQTLLACWKAGVPILMRGDSQLRTARSAARRAIKYLPYRWLLSRIAGHLCVGQRNHQYLRHYGVSENRLFFAPHFVDSEFFARGAQEARVNGMVSEIRNELRIPAEAFVALFVGKFIEKKRACDFVLACGRLDCLRDRPVHGVLVGDGPLRPELERLAAPWRNRFHFAGFRNQSQLPAWNAAADVLILPSAASETWGLVVNEAMASGIPAIVSDAVGCAPDLIDEGHTGFTYPVGDVAALVERLRWVESQCRTRHSEMQAALRAKVACYSIEGATEGLMAALKQSRRNPASKESLVQFA
jgi:glycosyltransferase involved in cell wall biosynthesis